jgi:hypothetical protein
MRTDFKFPDFLVLPTIAWGDLTNLYEVDYYDGPIEGMAIHNNNRYWYVLVDEYYPGSTRQRLFLLYELTAEQIQEHDYWHAKFTKAKHDSKDALDKFYEEYKYVKFIGFINNQARYMVYEDIADFGS